MSEEILPKTHRELKKKFKYIYLYMQVCQFTNLRPNVI